jgi:ankyrin repeat protein
VWDTASGECLRVLEGHTRTVKSVCVLGDGRLASASWDFTIRIWPKHLFTPSELIPHIKTGNLPKVLELINDGYDINSTKENPLLVACEHNQLPCVQLLLSLGADIEIKDSKGKTALICASEKGHLDIVKELINNGANIDAKDNDGKTALIISSNIGNLEIVKELLNNGANIDARDNKGMTSILSRNINVVKELLSRGINVEIWPDIFIIVNNPEIKELLLAYRQNK